MLTGAKKRTKTLLPFDAGFHSGSSLRPLLNQHSAALQTTLGGSQEEGCVAIPRPRLIDLCTRSAKKEAWYEHVPTCPSMSPNMC